MSIDSDFDHSVKVIIELRALSNRGSEFTKQMLDEKISEMLHEIEKEGKVLLVRWDFQNK